MNLKAFVFVFSFFLYFAAYAAWGSRPVWEPGETKCMPNFTRDRPVGYLCVKVEPGSLYARTGLQKGDNVSHINGKSLAGSNSIDEAIDLWKEFEKLPTATLTVERGDRTLTLKKPRD